MEEDNGGGDAMPNYTTTTAASNSRSGSRFTPPPPSSTSIKCDGDEFNPPEPLLPEAAWLSLLTIETNRLKVVENASSHIVDGDSMGE